MIKIGAASPAQTPCKDILSVELTSILGDRVEIIQKGALDWIPDERLYEYAPKEGEASLITPLRDGSGTFRMAKERLWPEFQQTYNYLEQQGCEMIIMFCTGIFPDTLCANVPILYPSKLLAANVHALSSRGKIAVVEPDYFSKDREAAYWKTIVREPLMSNVSPYGDFEEIAAVAHELKSADVDLIVLDCLGFDRRVKEIFAQETKKPVLLPRTIIARTVLNLMD